MWCWRYVCSVGLFILCIVAPGIKRRSIGLHSSTDDTAVGVDAKNALQKTHPRKLLTLMIDSFQPRCYTNTVIDLSLSCVTIFFSHCVGVFMLNVCGLQA